MIMALNVISIFKFKYDCTEVIFYISKINSHGVYVVKKEKIRKVSCKSKKMRCAIVNLHVNISESNHFNASNSDNVIVK